MGQHREIQMSDKKLQQSLIDQLPEAVITKQRGISIVWFIPLVACLIGGWLAYKTISESGPTITISFEDASGLEAGKTKIKYKSVIIGEVKKIELKSLQSVTVTAKMAKSGEKFMTEETKFWIVRPRIGGSEISGLETLVSGSYISVDPRPGSPMLNFKGLEKPPGVLVGEKGAQFKLHADDLGSVFPGTPILHRGVTVGRVVDYKFAEDGEGVLIDIFVKAPYHLLVRNGSRFWQQSGFNISFGLDGLKINIGSIASLITGGISFDSPITADGKSEPIKPGTICQLFQNHDSIGESKYVKKVPYLLHFVGSVRGLKKGAPVEFRGFKVGSVTDVSVTINPETLAITIPVIIVLEPERLTTSSLTGISKPYKVTDLMVQQGLRAQLQTGNLLTGQLYVDLDFHNDLAKEALLMDGKYPEIPTIPATLNVFKKSALDLMAEIRKIPFNKIGNGLLKTIQGANRLTNSPELLEAVHNLNATLTELHKLTSKGGALNKSFDNIAILSEHMDSKIAALAKSIEKTLKTIRNTMATADPNSPAVINFTNTMNELSSTARSVRSLADYLEQHPESLIHGKGKR